MSISESETGQNAEGRRLYHLTPAEAVHIVKELKEKGEIQ